MASKISLIAAMDANRGIGMDNKLPWRLPADHENFRRVTLGKPFLMGRKSYVSEDALLSDQLNLILSRSNTLNLCHNCQQVKSISEAFSLIEDSEDEWMILGGAAVFEQSLEGANYMYLTLVEGQFEADAFFPVVNWSEWEMVKSDFHGKDKQHAYSFYLNEYQRI